MNTFQLITKPLVLYRLLTVVLLLLFCTTTHGQTFKPDLSAWDPILIKKAKKKANHFLQLRRQNEIVFYCNLARMDGKLFNKTILKPYLSATGDTSYSTYLQSLIVTLNSKKNTGPLKNSFWLSILAKSHALKSGKKGTTGHQNFNKRMWLVVKLRNGAGENCSYGLSDPLDIVIDLLIDTGITDVGHRKNILDPSFKKMGVGFAKHKIYRINSVHEFSY